ncbi:MAG TPA: ABC transporter substrate-binding protein, partial [Actinomycetota bacterium]|nr:ABC transporter substrate-binding protein [Actinomycetota bacterium]
MSHRTNRALSAWALSCLVFFAACTGGDDPGPDAGASESPIVEPELSVTTPPPIFGAADRVLNVAIPEPATLDPMRISDPGASLIARQLYEGLTMWDPVLEKVKPAAAESWTSSPDGKTFTFKLRQGMSFHDGSPVTASDFIFAFDRIALKANASDLAYLLQDVVGFDAVNGSGTSGHLTGLRAPDDLTLVIQLSRPYQDLPALLTHPALVPLPRRAVEDTNKFLTQPTGNGPFQIAQPWSPGQSVILKAFAGFINTPDLDGIRFLAYPDAASSWIDFVKGNVDVSEVPAGQVADASRRFGEQGFVPFLKAEYIGVNLADGALKNPTLRKAINLAIDRGAIARTIYNGTLEPPRGIVPAGLPGFEENLCVDLCRYAPDTARALVRKLPRADRKVS